LPVKSLNLAFVVALSAAVPALATPINLISNGDFSTNGGVGELNYQTYFGTTYATAWTVGAQMSPTNGTGAFAFIVNSQADSFGFPSGNSTGPNDNLAIWGPGNSAAFSSGGPLPLSPAVTNGWNGVPVSAFGNSTHYALGVDGAYGTAPVSQTVNGLTVGMQYSLSFQYAYAQLAGYGGDVTEDWQVSFGANTVTTPSHLLTSPYTSGGTPETGGDQGFYGWNTYSNTFTATSTSELLSFLAQGSPNNEPFLMLTNVSLTAVPASTPEPQTWATALIGIACVALYSLRRKRASSARQSA
jgi:hypothetical protein